ncbi:MAG: hypothetical protein F6J87_08060 [Spirulina sp. SIO3F2]|nr:hypothetical protein [Spirulina sp. SIO3F2]
MAQLTLEIPDELAARLAPLQHQLPELLRQWANTQPPLESSLELASPYDSPPAVYTEILDFFLGRPTPEAVTQFKVSEPTQLRLRSLLDKNAEARLTTAEIAELDTYQNLEHFMILLKARAYQALS